MSASPLRVVLFALSGFGRPVLEALRQLPAVDVVGVFTEQRKEPLPYYEEEDMTETCQKMGVPFHVGDRIASDESRKQLLAYRPDLIIVSTFRQIIPADIIAIPRIGIVNMHPSLLPAYRGPCPIQAVILNEESETGVTVHWLTKGMDEGNILLKRSIPIGETDTMSTLHKKLAMLCAEIIPDVIALFAQGDRPAGEPQDAGMATLAPRPAPEAGYLERLADVSSMKRHVRALHPVPGTSILCEGKRLGVIGFEDLPGHNHDGIERNGNGIDVWRDGTGVRLLLR